MKTEKIERTQKIAEVNADFRTVLPFLVIHADRYKQIEMIPNPAVKDRVLIEFLQNIINFNNLEIKHFFPVLRKLKAYYNEEN